MDQTLIDRYMLNGERELSLSVNWVVDRLTLGLTANTSSYVLPAYVKDIRRVTFNGKKLIPMTENFRKGYFQGIKQFSNDIVFYATDFVSNNKDITFTPGPNSNYASGTDPWGLDIRDKCVIEYYRTTDTTFTLPSYVRTNFLRAYVGMKYFNKEGNTQNMKAVKYYTQLWEYYKKKWLELHNKILMTPRSYTIMGNPSNLYRPHLPVLPIDQFGYRGSDD